MKKTVPIVVLLILLVAVAAALSRRTVEPTAGRNNSLTLYGNVEIRDAQLAFNEQERVAEVLVEEGDVVEPGQVLARLVRARLEDQLAEAEAVAEAQRQLVKKLVSGTREQEVAQARAQVDAAAARVRNARRNVERLEDTAKTGASSRQALDDARAQLEIEEAALEVSRKTADLAVEGFRREDIERAKAMLVAREAGVRLFRDRLADTVLVASSAGVIQSRILEPGEMANPLRPAFVLALTDPKWVRAYVPEPELGRVAGGMAARVASDSFPGETFNGWVGFISSVAEFTPKSVQTTDLRTQLVYEVRIYVDDPDNRLRLGMPVSVEVDRTSVRRSGTEASEHATAR